MTPKKRANLLKGVDEEQKLIQNERFQNMQNCITEIFEDLGNDANGFNAEQWFEKLNKYIQEHERILYAPLSYQIYKWQFDHTDDDDNDLIGTIQTNIDTLLQCVEKLEKENREENFQEKYPRFDDARKALIKIWDHVNLAGHQYQILHKSDIHYERRVEEKFKAQEKKFNNRNKETIINLTKEMNGQLLTLVGIFTALAFLVFGGITSLDNIFSVHGIPLLKLMVICSLWGLTIINLVFVFLVCVSKMTKITFSSTENSKASVFQKYPIVWWTNLLLCSILALLSWLYFVRQNHALDWFKELCWNHPARVSCAGFGIIGVIIMVVACILLLHTNKSE